ncbi:PQQ-binding-like beta-propeller repeat protein [Streptomyces sp. M19]
MPPERLSGQREVTAASDVFSLGALLVYAATGRGPFDAPDPDMTAYQVVYEAPALGEVPEPLRGIAARCLARTPPPAPARRSWPGSWPACPRAAGSRCHGPRRGRPRPGVRRGPRMSYGRGRRRRGAASGGPARRIAVAAAVAALALGCGAVALFGTGGGGVRTSGGPSSGARTLLLPEGGGPGGWTCAKRHRADGHRPAPATRPAATSRPAPTRRPEFSSRPARPVSTGRPPCAGPPGAGRRGPRALSAQRYQALLRRRLLPHRPGRRRHRPPGLADRRAAARPVHGDRHLPLAVGDGRVLVTDSAPDPRAVDRLVALDARSGGTRWSRPVSGWPRRSPSGRVFALERGERALAAWDTTTGRTRWTSRVPGAGLRPHGVRGRAVLLCYATAPAGGKDAPPPMTYGSPGCARRRPPRPVRPARGRRASGRRRPRRTGAAAAHRRPLARAGVRGGAPRRPADRGTREAPLPRSAIGTPTLAGPGCSSCRTAAGSPRSTPVPARSCGAGRRTYGGWVRAGHRPGGAVYLCGAGGQLLALDLVTGRELWRTGARARTGAPSAASSSGPPGAPSSGPPGAPSSAPSSGPSSDLSGGPSGGPFDGQPRGPVDDRVDSPADDRAARATGTR